MSDAVDFYADKDVNVVVPQAGAFSYYTDWLEEPNGKYLKGPQKWETFLTKELPGPLESRLNASNKRAIAGMSMSATSSLLLAQHNRASMTRLAPSPAAPQPPTPRSTSSCASP